MACNEWNTLTRILLGNTAPSAPKNFRQKGVSGDAGEPGSALQTLGKVNLEEQPRFSTTISEFDRVLGGGLVPGSAVLIGGNPGAGKSTLLLQVMCQLSQEMDALYVTGEESLQQVGMRAKRLGLPSDNLKICLLYTSDAADE